MIEGKTESKDRFYQRKRRERNREKKIMDRENIKTWKTQKKWFLDGEKTK